MKQRKKKQTRRQKIDAGKKKPRVSRYQKRVQGEGEGEKDDDHGRE